MKTNCPMNQLLQELLQDQTDYCSVRDQGTNHVCCVILFMRYLITTHEPLELVEEIRKVIEK